MSIAAASRGRPDGQRGRPRSHPDGRTLARRGAERRESGPNRCGNLCCGGSVDVPELDHDGELVVVDAAGDDPSVVVEVQHVDPGARYRLPGGRERTEVPGVGASEESLDGDGLAGRANDRGACDGVREGRSPRGVPVPHVRLPVDHLAAWRVVQRDVTGQLS